jgi:hypothetical protein
MPLFTTDEKQFENFKNKAQSRAKSSAFNKDDQIVFKPNNTYKFRLMWWDNPKSDREGPFIEKYYHSCESDDGWKFCTCPTTFQPKTGFKQCPTCENNSKLWNSGSKADKELYRVHKRKYAGYALVYVISDPSNPDNNGQVKKMKFGVRMGKSLNTKVFGVNSDEGVEEEVIGMDAFKLKDGLDLIVRVSSEKTDAGEFNVYNIDFSRKPSDIEIDDPKALEAQIESLNFDDEYEKVSAEEVNRYFKKYVIDSVDDSDLPEESLSDDIDEDDLLSDDLTNEIESVDDVKVEDVDDVSIDEDDDLDALIADIEND